MAISASQVKALRDKTGAGMMDCKKALAETGGDEEKAIAYLREKGLAKAAKKAGRATSEGLIGFFMAADGKTAAIAELMCETDFVAKNDEFRQFAADLAAKVAALDLPAGPGGMTVGAAADLPGDMADVTNLIAKLGENMGVGRFAKASVADGCIGSYIHSNGKIGVLVPMTGSTNVDAARDVAMQVAAASPVCLTSAEVPADLLEKEKDIYRNQAIEEGKAPEIADKVVLGRVSKFYKEVCLLEQPFIKDDKKSIKQYLKEAAPGATVTSFVRLALGEGGESKAE
ncbi:translation elongation factor Ts [Desulfocurvus vexinensis]|uniref:translation elongation factor Ts n=1 Tax=Desulfocurvus vexinensis TaxID=399548 RepID=UPI00048B63DE|nr:translation elongation factor Ts [Desulfocurvus vexinensis]